jgi:hypothetical protein
MPSWKLWPTNLLRRPRETPSTPVPPSRASACCGIMSQKPSYGEYVPESGIERERVRERTRASEEGLRRGAPFFGRI